MTIDYLKGIEEIKPIISDIDVINDYCDNNTIFLISKFMSLFFIQIILETINLIFYGIEKQKFFKIDSETYILIRNSFYRYKSIIDSFIPFGYWFTTLFYIFPFWIKNFSSSTIDIIYNISLFVTLLIIVYIVYYVLYKFENNKKV